MGYTNRTKPDRLRKLMPYERAAAIYITPFPFCLATGIKLYKAVINVENIAPHKASAYSQAITLPNSLTALSTGNSPKWPHAAIEV